MKNYQKLLLFLFIALAVAAVISPWVAVLWNSVFDTQPEFAEIFGPVFIATASALILSTRSLLRRQFLTEAGLGPLQRGYLDLLRGFAVAVASMAVLGLLMSLAGIFTPGFFHAFQDSLRWSVKALMTALMVGFLEELFFRGMLFKGLLEDTRRTTAFAAANLFYAAVHFPKPPEKFSVSGLDPLAGVRFLGESLQPFLNPAEILPGLIGLFIISLVLSYAFFRTRALYLSIGLHAGWVFALKTMRVYGEFQRGDLGWAFGSTDPKIVSGVVTWIGILAVGVVVHFLTRHHPNPLPRREREGRGL
ncbi:MAG TPA: CPBP family intramembrane glutamic endopeptidase [Candidatus Binatia bacterium]